MHTQHGIFEGEGPPFVIQKQVIVDFKYIYLFAEKAREQKK
jgi:hypothetical protein